MLTDKIYNRLKWTVSIVLPAISSAYFTLASIWGWDNPEKVVGTIAVITTFLGVILGISTRKYNVSGAADGEMVVTEVEDGKKFSLQLDKTPDELAERKRISFKIVHRE